MKSYVAALGTAVPKYRTPQTEIANFMANILQLNPAERQRLYALYRASGIHYRHSVLSDYSNINRRSFYPDAPNLEPFPTIKQRMDVYEREALSLSYRSAKNCLQQLPQFNPKEITHLIFVSCTGMYAPGVDIELIHQLGLSHQVQRTAINFMGCYAAFNALKVADSIVRADTNANVLMVCTELCTLHFQKGKDEDNLLANALFADGSSAALVTRQKFDNAIQFSLEQFYCDLVPEASQEMAWQIGNYGFEMKLSAYVPEAIKQGIYQLTQQLMNQLSWSVDEASLDVQEKPDFYAIHPGGKRILQVIEQALSMEKADNRFAYQILQQYGNMSSATILFVLKALHQDLTVADNDKSVLGLAFGPGLTLESMLLRVETF
ncbi:type III polyketide synthase [Tunicatimonas pelagia]|uniref:type III polyketide synthase n=1 Tax=Tunicatimonas pelagia TaxID=931531 RepID=UPI00266608BF|nr:type III polyketide synthase [Tunicatimonas pelagia]WKN45917.1 type III polyketide synthase [Tunicatimonas pelagia]